MKARPTRRATSPLICDGIDGANVVGLEDGGVHGDGHGLDSTSGPRARCGSPVSACASGRSRPTLRRGRPRGRAARAGRRGRARRGGSRRRCEASPSALPSHTTESRTQDPVATSTPRGQHRVRADVGSGRDPASGPDVERAFHLRARVDPGLGVDPAAARAPRRRAPPGNARSGCRDAPGGTSRGCRCRSSTRDGPTRGRGRRGARRAGKKARSIEWFWPGGIRARVEVSRT